MTTPASQQEMSDMMLALQESLETGLRSGMVPASVTVTPEFERLVRFLGVPVGPGYVPCGRYLIQYMTGLPLPYEEMAKTCVCGSQQPKGRGHSTWCDVYE